MFGRYAYSKTGFSSGQNIAYSAVFSDGVAVADLEAFGNIAYLPIVEPQVISDTIVGGFLLTFSITEPVKSSETETATKAAYPTIQENVGVADANSEHSTFGFAATEGATLTDDMELLAWQNIKDYAPANWVPVDDSQ